MPGTDHSDGKDRNDVQVISEPPEYKSRMRAAESMANTHEVQKSVRLAIVCATIVVSLGILVVGSVMLLKEDFAWKIASGIFAIIAAATAPTVVYKRAKSRFKADIKYSSGRVKKLEASIDSERTSSELREDGTNKPGDLL